MGFNDPTLRGPSASLICTVHFEVGHALMGTLNDWVSLRKMWNLEFHAHLLLPFTPPPLRLKLFQSPFSWQMMLSFEAQGYFIF